jgi:hypothetical protein
MFKNLSPALKIKVRLADALDMQAEDAPNVTIERQLTDRADALRAEVAAAMQVGS